MNDETNTTPATDAANQAPPEPTAAERLTGQAAKPTKAKATKKAKAYPATALAGGEEAEAEALGLAPEAQEKAFRVHCPSDPTMPARIVKGLTPADAKEAYCREMGIIVAGHPLLATPAE